MKTRKKYGRASLLGPVRMRLEIILADGKPHLLRELYAQLSRFVTPQVNGRRFKWNVNDRLRANPEEVERRYQIDPEASHIRGVCLEINQKYRKIIDEPGDKGKRHDIVDLNRVYQLTEEQRVELMEKRGWTEIPPLPPLNAFEHSEDK